MLVPRLLSCADDQHIVVDVAAAGTATKGAQHNTATDLNWSLRSLLQFCTHAVQ